MDEKENKEQKFLKKLDTFNQVTNSILWRIFIVIYVIVMLFLLAGAVYYGMRGNQSSTDEKQFIICSVTFMGMCALLGCGKLFDKLMNKFYERDNTLDPATMKLPQAGTVKLEDALHIMSTQTAVIVWDTICGCIIFSLLFCVLFVGGNWTRVLLICVYMTVFLVAGHILFHWLWKKRSFKKKLLRNTAQYLSIENLPDYEKKVEESLNRAVLCYEKEFVMTEDYILGNAQRDTSFIPVAIPANQITEFIFFYKKMVTSRYVRTCGILRCVLRNGKSVDLILDMQPKAEKILRILNYRHINVKNGAMIYN